jgi:hypothetical protein
MFLDPNDPLVKQGMNARCHYNQPSLLPVTRYVNAFKALRPQNENLVIFAAITGVPADLVSGDVLAKIDFANDDQRGQLYARILQDARMQEVVDGQGTDDVSDDRLEHSCNGSSDIHADPPIRIVQVAQGFGANGVVQSICQDDYGPAINAVAARVGSKLGPGRLARPIARANDGLIACDLLWQLPLASSALPGTPTRCAQAGAEFLRPRTAGSTTDERGGAICQVVQLTVNGDVKNSVAPTIGGMTFKDGWYYDDFSPVVAQACGESSAQHIAYTGAATPPPDVRVTLDCAQ